MKVVIELTEREFEKIEEELEMAKDAGVSRPDAFQMHHNSLITTIAAALLRNFYETKNRK